ncbi:MAG: WG repeat-containing protein [Deltaproteobacteria bacterium]|jgi:hypothetical protein|nr:WG repeat-containing protein [Deltaproteobacteria bacterium]
MPRLKPILKNLFFGILLISALLFPMSSPVRGYGAELVPAPPDASGKARGSKGGGRDLHFFLLGRNFGYVNSKGEMAIEPSFLKADNFGAGGLARVQTPEGWGLINERGDYAVQPVLDDVLVCENGDDPALFGLWKDWWGRISPDGKWLDHPRFHKVECLDLGFSAVFVRDKCALMDFGGKLLTPFGFDSIGKFIKDEHGRLLSVVSEGGKKGLLDGSGKILIPPSMDEIKPEFDLNGQQIRTRDGLYGVLDLNGKWIIEPKFRLIESDEDGKRYRVKETNLSDSHFYYDLTGKKLEAVPRERILALVGKLPHKLIGCFQDNDDKLFGYCDDKGQVAIKPEYEFTAPFAENGLARVKKGGLFGYINPKGEKVVDFKFTDARDFNKRGAALVKDAGGWGMIDAKGTFLIEPSLDALPRVQDEELSFGTVKGKTGILSAAGEWILPPELEDFQAFRENGLAWVKKDGLWGQVDRKGSWILPPGYQDVGLHSPGGLAPAYRDGGFAVVDENGKSVARSAAVCGQNAVLDSSGKITYPKTPELKDCEPE